MSLAQGRHYLAIPGPSVMPDRVLQAMHRPAPNIYEGELIDLTKSLMVDLKKVARTRHHAAMYICNGHGAWEASLANTHCRGDKSLVIATGRFGIGWGDMAARLGIDTEVLDFGKRSTYDLTRVEEILAADTEHNFKSVLVVHVDTATSVKNDVAALRALLDRLGHPALLMADCIASLVCDRFEMDDWGADVMVAGCQKGLMTPPGMAFVFFNDRADRVRDTADLASSYWDWRPRSNPQEYYEYFGGTAPTHHLYGLRVALDMIAEEGLENVWARHNCLARAIWAAVEAWGADGPLELNISDPKLRSCAVTALRIGAPLGSDLRTWLTGNAGVTLGIGLGMTEMGDPAASGFFRIGHMGHVNAHMALGVLGSMQAGMTALGIPFGPGALEAAAKICSEG